LWRSLPDDNDCSLSFFPLFGSPFSRVGLRQENAKVNSSTTFSLWLPLMILIFVSLDPVPLFLPPCHVATDYPPNWVVKPASRMSMDELCHICCGYQRMDHARPSSKMSFYGKNKAVLSFL
jgi:hypothetical protein